MIDVLLIGLFSAFLTLFLNYCIGKPGSEFNPYEIFSFYTVWLSIKRLEKVGIYQEYANQYNENAQRTENKSAFINLDNEFKKILYQAAEPYFTWERMAGMCSICTGFWVTLITSLFFYQNVVYLIIQILISHIAIRLLNKIL